MDNNLNKDLLNNNCQELTDIKYKTMFISRGSLNNNSTLSKMENEKNISLLLDNELVKNKSEPWSKLSKTAKITKNTLTKMKHVRKLFIYSPTDI